MSGRMRRGIGCRLRCKESISRCEVMTGVVRWKERRSGRMREVKNVTAAAAAAANIPVPAMEQLAR